MHQHWIRVRKILTKLVNFAIELKVSLIKADPKTIW